MSKLIKFIVAGIIFGIVLTKSEVVSWYRIQEMFRFQSFHMFGIIGSAVVLGVILVQFIKRRKVKTMQGEEIVLPPKEKSFTRYFVGGTIFGLGWALTGACPGPMYSLMGQGYSIIFVIVLSALAGTMFYGALRDKLPH